MLQQTIRGLAFALWVLLFLGGLIAISAGGAAAISGAWSVVFASVIMVAVVLQRNRYRSGAAERAHAEPGPGGGEPGVLEPRFVPTNEVFTDPTTRLVMRVFVDPRTGERRYRAEARF
jgi:hypothetical protein